VRAPSFVSARILALQKSPCEATRVVRRP
jgi:hypothetical protein